jgi:transcriptional regulator of heat shock response
METAGLEPRKKEVLFAVVREYVKTAEPVGSVTLIERYGFDLSSATIRNELAALEELGLIEQPHTSSGRIPSERGFQLFVDTVLASRSTGDERGRKRKVRMPEVAQVPEEAVKSVAKHIAEHANEAVIVAFGPRHLYYTGLSHLFSQPEFQEFGRVVRFSELIDRLDDIVAEVHPRVGNDVTVWLGRKNPFGSQCGTVVARCSVGGGAKGIVGILGPLRMDYERCIELVDTTQQLFAETFSS